MLRILVVDDDADIRGTLCDLLEAEGYEVSSASNGSEALELLRADPGRRPSVILLDLMMPVMSGWQFLSVRKDDPELAPIPVAVISASNDFRESIKGLAVNESLSKPLDFDRLLGAVERCCAASGQAG
jgi:CheY-like chemotaxis protein